MKTYQKENYSYSQIVEPTAEQIKKSNVIDLLKFLKTNKELGLTNQEAQKRIQQFGRNKVEEKKKNKLRQFLMKFWGLTAWLLEIIIVISIATNKFVDAGIVIFLLIFNSALGFYEEENADNAVEALKKRLQINSRVIRNGKWSVIQAYDLTLGDIVRVRNGDYIPADLKIIEGELMTDESALTGESLNVSKNISDLAYSGSVCTEGEATCLVVGIGEKTYFGKTVSLVKNASVKIHAEEMVYKVVQTLLVIVSVILAFTLIFAVVKGIAIVLVLPLTLILLLGAIPVALPAMFTVSMALGAKQLVEQGVLVTRLGAPDDAASMDILCVDKTGTITENKIEFSGAIGGFNGFDDEKVRLYAALASTLANNDAIDKAILTDYDSELLKKYSIIKFFPFDPKTRMTKVEVRDGKNEFLIVKGAVDSIIKICNLKATNLKKIQELINKQTNDGYRVLAVASGKYQTDLKLAGIVTLFDKPRSDSSLLIEKLGNLGIKVKMLTGDAKQVALNIGKKVGITGQSIDSEQLALQIKNNNKKIVEKYDLFSQVYPQDKFTIVKTLQKLGHIVGMTGDGINDAPALKEAEVGIAVSSSTDVAKGASSVVLTDSGLTNIISLIIVGRQMFSRINNWIINKISKTILQVFFIVIAFLMTGQIIISSTAMLLLIFMIDFVIISLSTDNVRISSTPQIWKIENLVKKSAVLGGLLVIEALFLLWIEFSYFHFPIKQIQTFSFLVLFFFTIFLIFVARESGRFYHSAPSLTLITVILIDSILACFISLYGIFGLTKIPLNALLTIILLTAIFSFVINDYVKTKIVQINFI